MLLVYIRAEYWVSIWMGKGMAAVTAASITAMRSGGKSSRAGMPHIASTNRRQLALTACGGEELNNRLLLVFLYDNHHDDVSDHGESGFGYA